MQVHRGWLHRRLGNSPAATPRRRCSVGETGTNAGRRIPNLVGAHGQSVIESTRAESNALRSQPSRGASRPSASARSRRRRSPRCSRWAGGRAPAWRCRSPTERQGGAADGRVVGWHDPTTCPGPAHPLSSTSQREPRQRSTEVWSTCGTRQPFAMADEKRHDGNATRSSTAAASDGAWRTFKLRASGIPSVSTTNDTMNADGSSTRATKRGRVRGPLCLSSLRARVVTTCSIVSESVVGHSESKRERDGEERARRPSAPSTVARSGDHSATEMQRGGVRPIALQVRCLSIEQRFNAVQAPPLSRAS